ncbi:hypothetical protein B566_EDAN007673 [Ephemera danica]|nr:hypothetical protein B566_EDAN007673 [Ephemera danica]
MKSILFQSRDPIDQVLDHMIRTMNATKTDFKPLPGYQKTVRGHYEDRRAAGLDCDEVYPNIFIGDAGTARNKQYLQRIGITHVLNCAEGGKVGQVNTGATYYEGCPIKYLGLKLADLPVANIKKYFDCASEFIEQAISSNGRILVHCVMGMSRSSTCVVAYLMLHQKSSAATALQTIRRGRDVRPNPGFMRQLAELELELIETRRNP